MTLPSQKLPAFYLVENLKKAMFSQPKFYHNYPQKTRVFSIDTI